MGTTQPGLHLFLSVIDSELVLDFGILSPHRIKKYLEIGTLSIRVSDSEPLGSSFTPCLRR